MLNLIIPVNGTSAESLRFSIWNISNSALVTARPWPNKGDINQDNHLSYFNSSYLTKVYFTIFQTSTYLLALEILELLPVPYLQWKVMKMTVDLSLSHPITV